MAEETQGELTREDKQFLIKTLWQSLQAPDWEPKPLEKFGRAIYAKKTLKELDDKDFEMIFPYLEKVATAMGMKLREQSLKIMTEEAAKAAKPAGEKPAETTKPAEAAKPTGEKPTDDPGKSPTGDKPKEEKKE